MSKEVTILFNDRIKTSFMQAADVFEKFKVVYKEAVATVVDDFGDTHIAKMLEQMKDRPYGLIAIYDDTHVYYRDPNVKVLSDGTRIYMLDDFLPLAKVS